MEVTRNIEPLLAEYLIIFPVVGIIRPRQVGKTTLAKALAGLGDLEVSYLKKDMHQPFKKMFCVRCK